jgi:hypothetical protein
MSLPRAAVAVAVAVALALAAGCEHDDMRTPIAVSPIAALPALSAAQTRGLVSLPWHLAQTAPAGLFIEVPAVGCPRLRGTVVTETPTDVTVQVFASLGSCSDAAPGFIAAPVRLSAPLGGRHLRHGGAVQTPASARRSLRDQG